MPRQRWSKAVTRAFAAATGSNYTTAAASLSRLDPAGRTQRAARTLSVDCDDAAALAAAVCLFAGVAPPSGPLSQAMVQRLAVITDAIPLATLATRRDLLDAATATGAAKVIPAIPDPITAVLATLTAEIALMEPAQLRTLAAELGVNGAALEVAAILTLDDAERDEAGAGAAFGVFDVRQVLGHRDREERARRAVRIALTHNPPESWGSREVLVLRHAVRQVLAAVGDGLLCTGEWEPQPMTWTPLHPDTVVEGHQALEVATRKVPGRATPLTAHLLAEAPRRRGESDDVDRSPLFPGDHTTPVAGAQRWSVGWEDVQGRCHGHGVGTASSPAAARHAAAVHVSDLLADPERVWPKTP